MKSLAGFRPKGNMTDGDVHVDELNVTLNDKSGVERRFRLANVTNTTTVEYGDAVDCPIALRTAMPSTRNALFGTTRVGG